MSTHRLVSEHDDLLRSQAESLVGTLYRSAGAAFGRGDHERFLRARLLADRAWQRLDRRLTGRPMPPRTPARALVAAMLGDYAGVGEAGEKGRAA